MNDNISLYLTNKFQVLRTTYSTIKPSPIEPNNRFDNETSVCLSKTLSRFLDTIWFSIHKQTYTKYLQTYFYNLAEIYNF